MRPSFAVGIRLAETIVTSLLYRRVGAFTSLLAAIAASASFNLAAAGTAFWVDRRHRRSFACMAAVAAAAASSGDETGCSGRPRSSMIGPGSSSGLRQRRISQGA